MGRLAPVSRSIAARSSTRCRPSTATVAPQDPIFRSTPASRSISVARCPQSCQVVAGSRCDVGGGVVLGEAVGAGAGLFPGGAETVSKAWSMTGPMLVGDTRLIDSGPDACTEPVAAIDVDRVAGGPLDRRRQRSRMIPEPSASQVNAATCPTGSFILPVPSGWASPRPVAVRYATHVPTWRPGGGRSRPERRRVVVAVGLDLRQWPGDLRRRRARISGRVDRIHIGTCRAGLVSDRVARLGGIHDIGDPPKIRRPGHLGDLARHGRDDRAGSGLGVDPDEIRSASVLLPFEAAESRAIGGPRESIRAPCRPGSRGVRPSAASTMRTRAGCVAVAPRMAAASSEPGRHATIEIEWDVQSVTIAGRQVDDRGETGAVDHRVATIAEPANVREADPWVVKDLDGSRAIAGGHVYVASVDVGDAPRARRATGGRRHRRKRRSRRGRGKLVVGAGRSASFGGSVAWRPTTTTASAIARTAIAASRSSRGVRCIRPVVRPRHRRRRLRGRPVSIVAVAIATASIGRTPPSA